MTAEDPIVGIHLDLKYLMPRKAYLLEWVQRLPELGVNTLLAVPTVVVTMRFVRLARLRIHADRTAVAWLRIGATRAGEEKSQCNPDSDPHSRHRRRTYSQLG